MAKILLCLWFNLVYKLEDFGGKLNEKRNSKPF